MKKMARAGNRLSRGRGDSAARSLAGVPGGRGPRLSRGLSLLAALWLLFFPALRPVPAEVVITLREGPLRGYSGESVRATLAISGLPPGAASAAWKLLAGRAAVGSGEAAGERVGEGEATVIVDLRFPEVARPVELSWAVRVFAGGQPAGEAVFPFRVYPRDLSGRLRAILSPRRPGVYDPKGGLAGLLDSLGVEFTLLGSPQALRAFRGGVLLVGPGAFSSPRESFFSLLEEAGVESVLVLEQAVFPGDLPLELEAVDPLPAPGGPVLPAAPGHPALAGLEAEDLPPAAGRPLKKPGRGNYRSLLDPGPGSPAIGGPFSLVLEALPGRKRLVFCQIPLVEAAGRDPGAGLLLAALAGYLPAGREEPEPVFVIGGPGEGEEEFCREMGLPEPRLSLPPEGYRRAVVFAGRRTVAALAGKEEETAGGLAALAVSGGRLLVLGLEPESLDFWWPLLPEGLELEELPSPDFGAPRDPLFWGISPADWEECLGRAAAAGLPLYGLRGGDLRPVAPPLVAKAVQGAGSVAVCQYPFHRLSGEPAAAAAAAQFLSNFRLDRGPGPAERQEAGE